MQASSLESARGDMWLQVFGPCVVCLASINTWCVCNSHIAAGCGGAEETALPRAAPLGADGQGNRYFRLGAEAGACPQELTHTGWQERALLGPGYGGPGIC